MIEGTYPLAPTGFTKVPDSSIIRSSIISLMDVLPMFALLGASTTVLASCHALTQNGDLRTVKGTLL